MILATLLLSWLGFYLHNIMSLPDAGLLSANTAYPTLVYLVLAGVWLLAPGRLAARALLVWGAAHALGGGVITSGLFFGDSSLDHYAAHAVYTLLQVPLLVAVTVRGCSWRSSATRMRTLTRSRRSSARRSAAARKSSGRSET